MKWFWISLIGFCVLMCSCKTQKVDREMNILTNEDVYTEMNEVKMLVDTSRIYKFDIDKSKLTITERIKVTEYDAESGKPIKETEAERKIAQDTDKVSTEEENKSVTNCNVLEAEQFRDTTKKMDSEVKEESIGGQESFGKWFGIVVGVGIIIVLFVLIVYLWSKFKK